MPCAGEQEQKSRPHHAKQKASLKSLQKGGSEEPTTAGYQVWNVEMT